MPAPHRAEPEAAFGRPSFRALYGMTAVVAVLVAADLLGWWLGAERLRNPWGVNLALAAAVLGGARIVYGAVAGLLEGTLGADLALAIALLAALVLGEYWVGAEVVLIALVGESLEALTFSRTHRELRKILELRPRVVRVRRGEQTAELPVDAVQVGDLVVIRPGERIPVDGTVLTGRSAVDQSTLTGESLPADKGPGEAVFAGTLNQFGALEVRAEKIGAATTLGQVIQLVAQARENKADVERAADRLARYFLPGVLTLAAATFVVTNWTAWTALVAGGATAWVWMPTLAVLVVACPCALILATPAAMMAALAWLARRGVLITGGAALERLAGATQFAFDKTGTLTTGQLQLGECVAQSGYEPRQVLAWAALAEQASEHLLGQLLVRAARDQGLSWGPVEEFQALPGAGVWVRSAGLPPADAGGAAGTALVGNRRLMIERGVPLPAAVDDTLRQLEQSGQTPLLVAVNQQLVGVIGVRDTVRPEAAAVVQQLRQLGIAQFALLTGDRPAAAAQVAQAVGIERWAAELRPEDKAQWLAAWGHDSERLAGCPRRVAMVGDGVNDAPALAMADVGLALGGVGSDIAAEAGDLILMGDPLRPLPGLVQLSRETVRVIRQNIIVFAFLVNLVGIVVTGWVLPRWSPAWMARAPVAAALFHQVGSVLVLLNAMRLLWFERWQRGWCGRIESALARLGGWCWARCAPLGTGLDRLWRVRGVVLRGAGGLLLAGYLTQTVVFVQPDEVVLVQRFGRLRAVLPPGAHLRLPPPWETITRERPQRVRTVALGLRRTASGGVIEWSTPHQGSSAQTAADEALFLTGDQSLVELSVTVQYRIAEVRAFRFGVRDPERLLRAAAESVVRQAMAGQPLLAETDDDAGRARELLTSGRGPIEQHLRDELQARVAALELGLEILPRGVCLQDVHPPLAVVAAFRDVSSAFKEKERMRNEADAYQREKVIRAAGETAWQALVSAPDAGSDELWSRLEPQLAGEVVAELNAARAATAVQESGAAGDATSFLRKEAAQAGAPPLSAWRMYVDTLAQTMPGKEKLILDAPGAGRRQLLLGLPGPLAPATLPLVSPPPAPAASADAEP